MSQHLTIDEAVELMNSGRVFTATVKRRTDGEYTDINARRGVKKGVKGTGQNRAEVDKKNNQLTVKKMGKLKAGDQGWRVVALERLKFLAIDNRIYRVGK